MPPLIVTRRRTAFFFLGCALLLLSACGFSDSSVEETPVERIYIVDQSGKHWDVTQAVVRYGFTASGFKFGLGALTPLINPAFAAPGDSVYPNDTDTFPVIGLSRSGTARAYRLADLVDIEVADDIFAGEPVVVVHRPLVDAPSACTRMLDGDTLTIAASGWVYDNESVLFDHESDSMWYRLGSDGALTCIAGAHFGSVLPAVSSSVTLWNTWHAGHPASTFMLRPR
ncbi:MAG TPA: DUF3179 domain-containing (seleno)protein [Candidatus Krumholzibacteria bacterium]|nr:DUF3179 domain-containing (seleno)protein [Candidatus Krumholzibacteria bacterium]